ncbi:MAG: alpha/beta hydrolase [Bacteroidia bacterium]|nr:alpha/beta hydrolase [Bacteroidia bacterium]
MKKFFKYLFRLIFLLILIAAIGLGTQYHADIPLSSLKSKYANNESQFIAIEGMDIHYRDEGQGAPLLLLHGTGASLHTWNVWAEKLQLDFRVIRMDLPAYGLTGPHPKAEYEPSRYVEVIHQFLKELEIDTVYVAGNSFGGALAWQYAYKYPKQVKKMILVDPSGFAQDEPPRIIKLARNPLVQPILKYITPKFFVSNNLKSAYHDPSVISDELKDRYFDMALREGNRQAFIDRASGSMLDETAKLTAITTPTLIMWGESDTWIPLENAYKFNQVLVNSQLITYPEAGHVPMEEIPVKTSGDAREFLLGEGEEIPELN